MSTIPVIASVLSAEHLSAIIQQHYRLTKPVTCTLVKTFVNDTYIVKEKKQVYAFRVYRYGWRTKKEVAEEIRFINRLKENNIPVSYAIADVNGEYIQELEAPEGTRWGVLFSFAPGKKIYNPSTAKYYAIAQLMATIHQHSNDVKPDRITYTPQVVLVDSFNKFRTYIPDDSADMEFMLKTQQQVLDELSNTEVTAVRWGVVHLDTWADNMHIDDAGNITLFDFDFCGNGWLCYDIAFSLQMLCSMEPSKESYIDKATAFLNGYESVSTISEAEKRILPALGTALNFYYLGAQRELFSTVFFNEEHVRRFIQFRIKKWIEYNHR